MSPAVARCLIPLLASATLWPAAHPRVARVARVVDACAGCTGASGSLASSGGLGDGIVELAVVVGRGRCDWTWDDSSKRLECRQRRGCEPTVTRVWRDLPPEVDVDHCVELGERELCLVPRPHSGRGWGRTLRTGPDLPCREAGALAFTVGNVPFDLAAKATAHCASCRGSS